VALVTGAGAGFGRESPTCLPPAGARVAVADVNVASARETVARLQALELEAFAFEVDIAVEPSVTSLFAAIEAAVGPVECLVNNAGVQPSRLLLDMTLAEWEEVHRVNSRGTFLCTREADVGCSPTRSVAAS
jgi:NAD(P)-dependent dehydrogenase (short-subunit alcohol dehydrogenase family)